MSEFVKLSSEISRFPELVQSRREWIEQVLVPWCRTASRKDLLLAEQAWPDIAGRPDPQQTLWLWGWQRFPDLCDESLTALNETWPVEVTLRSGGTCTGYPDARQSVRGELVLIALNGSNIGPLLIDEIVSVTRQQQ
ncbi:MAG TPA: hypothetical protein VNQ76_03600 [Planctomicrobium sp.]|nr:hypothetical protein [Planctomicrobium sp.]